MSRALRTARRGAILTFVLAGLMVGTMTVRIPAITDKLGLSDSAVGSILLAWGLGALITMQSMRGIMSRTGSKTMMRIGGPLTALALVGLAYAPTYPLVLLSVALFGMAFGVLDVAMNAQGSTVEQSCGRPLMNGMHAGWSVGAMVAGLVGSLSIAGGLSLTTHLTLVGLITLPLIVLINRTYLPDTPAPERAASAVRRRLPPIIYLFGVIMFLAFMVEGIAADWNGLFMRDALGAPEAVAALGYPVFEAGMLLARVSGDRLRSRFGVKGMMAVSGLATAAFFSLVLTATTPALAIGAMFFVGVGVATIAPMTLSLAGKTSDNPGPAIAQASAMGYSGLLLGPVIIGFLSDATSLHTAMGLTIVLGLGIAALSRLLPRPRRKLAHDREHLARAA